MNLEANNISFTAPGSAMKNGMESATNIRAYTPSFEAKENQQVESNPQDAAKPRNFATDDGERKKALESKLVSSDSALVIEKDPNGAGFIYKSIDRKTGEIVRLWPRQEIASALQALQDIDARGLMLDESA